MRPNKVVEILTGGGDVGSSQLERDQLFKSEHVVRREGQSMAVGGSRPFRIPGVGRQDAARAGRDNLWRPKGVSLVGICDGGTICEPGAGDSAIGPSPLRLGIKRDGGVQFNQGLREPALIQEGVASLKMSVSGCWAFVDLIGVVRRLFGRARRGVDALLAELRQRVDRSARLGCGDLRLEGSLGCDDAENLAADRAR